MDMTAHCKGKMVCEADEPKEEGADGDEPDEKKGHGGCGAVQPVIRKEGLKLFAQYKKPKDDDDVRAFSQTFTPAQMSSRKSNPFNLTSASSLPPTLTPPSRKCLTPICTFLVFRRSTLVRSG